MAITVQALQADGTWGVRSAFTTENAKVRAGSMKAADLEALARATMAKWQQTSCDGKQLRVHNSDNEPKSAEQFPSTKFQGFKIEQNESGFFWQEGGYHDTLAECQAEIADHNSDLRSPENVHGLASIQQSIEEDRARARR